MKVVSEMSCNVSSGNNVNFTQLMHSLLMHCNIVTHVLPTPVMLLITMMY